jgi:hypothetical protein
MVVRTSVGRRRTHPERAETSVASFRIAIGYERGGVRAKPKVERRVGPRPRRPAAPRRLAHEADVGSLREAREPRAARGLCVEDGD